VAGWGAGTLWTSADSVVLAHEFAFVPDASHVASHAVSPAARAAPHAAPLEGAGRPPGATVPTRGSRMGHAFASNHAHPGADGGSAHPTESEPPSTGEIVAWLTAFLTGTEAPLERVPLDLGWCSPFQRAVGDALRAVPRGEVVSYGELAALAGHPNAQRAVGTFCAHNRFMFLVPCHRVVGADGIGGYGSAGVGVKRRLLALEGVDL